MKKKLYVDGAYLIAPLYPHKDDRVIVHALFDHSDNSVSLLEISYIGKIKGLNEIFSIKDFEKFNPQYIHDKHLSDFLQGVGKWSKPKRK